MPKVDVLHVIARMNIGGTARYIAVLMHNIPNSKLATGHVQASEIEDPCVEKIEVIRIGNLGRKISLKNDYFAWRHLSKIIREMEPRIVHTHTFKAGLIGRLVRGDWKHVHTFHGHLLSDDSFSRLKKIFLIFIERLLASKTDMLISVGEKVGQELREVGIGTKQEWLSIAPGVTTLAAVDKSLARRSLSLDNSGLLIGWLARMETVKNPQLLLQVASKLPNVQFVMAGGGSLLEEIMKCAPGNVSVIGWADAALFWSAADIAISTSKNEGMPVALIEAQLAGIPVVATDVGSTSEVIINGVTGFVVSEYVDEIVNAILQLTSNSELLGTMKKNSILYAQARFSVDNFIEKQNSAYTYLKC